MNVRRISALIVVLAVTLGVAPSATAQTDTASPADQGKTTFVVGTTEDITSANPFAATSTGTDYEMLFLSYDMLLNFDQSNLEPAPGIASSWEPSKDGSSYTFHIRKGMTWSDGKPVTADD